MVRENKQPRKTSKCCKGGITRKLDKDGFCIAHMTDTEDLQTGLVNVEYLSSLSCHQPSVGECKYLPLPPQSIKRCKKSVQQE